MKETDKIREIKNTLESELSHEQKFGQIFKICLKMVSERRNDEFHGSSRDEWTPEDRAVHSFVLSWSFFYTRMIDFQDWQDVCVEGLSILKRFISSDSLDPTSIEGYQNFRNLFKLRYDEIHKSPKYSDTDKWSWHEPGYWT